MRDFEALYGDAAVRKGSESVVEASLPKAKASAQLKKLPDSYYLSEMSRRVFRAGLRHSMVDAKWPGFDKAFFDFDPIRVSRMSDEELEQLMDNKAIIRHFGKIKSVRHNALMLTDLAREHGSFAKFVADWPVNQIIELWQTLKKHGSQLGGQSAARFLRMVGKDTFLLTDDVVNVLKVEGVVDKLPTSQRDLKKAQEAFNLWQEESGRSLCEISRIISFIPGY